MDAETRFVFSRPPFERDEGHELPRVVAESLAPCARAYAETARRLAAGPRHKSPS